MARIVLHDCIGDHSNLAVYGTTIIKVFGTQDNNNNIINSLFTDDKQLSAKGLVSSSSLPFIPSQTIAIPNVNGRIDHMAVDIADQRLFVAELKQFIRCD